MRRTAYWNCLQTHSFLYDLCLPYSGKFSRICNFTETIFADAVNVTPNVHNCTKFFACKIFEVGVQSSQNGKKNLYIHVPLICRYTVILVHTHVVSMYCSCHVLHRLNFSYMIHTEIDTTVPVPTEASLVWPTLYPHKVLQFPHTTIGNASVSDSLQHYCILTPLETVSCTCMRVNVSPKGGQGGTPLPLISLHMYICVLVFPLQEGPLSLSFPFR